MSAYLELFKRYRRVWKAAWRQRKSMDAPPREPYEIEFLPAALALQDNPLHPAPRVIGRCLMVFAALALLWACLGHMDVVATASGRVVPNGKSKLIQPSTVAVVKAIYVQDGQAVEQGDLLVELDSSLTIADINRLQNELTAAQIDNARAEALLEAIDNQKPPADLTKRLAQLSADKQQSAQHWLDGQYQELQSLLAQADSSIKQHSAELQTAQILIASLKQTLPLVQEQTQAYKKLLEKHHTSRHSWMEKEQERLEAERELALQQSRRIELEAALQSAQQQKQTLLAQNRRALLDLLNQSRQMAANLEQELHKAEQQHRLMYLKAPVVGNVQQLAIHTAGGVVTEAQPLMVIVPKDQPIEVEALLENKDIGFVYPGQAVKVKIETFTFTKYGAVPAIVQSISSDAIEDERLGLVYSTRIQLSQDHLIVGNRKIKLSPGMAVRAEIKTDQRRIIDYFLSPLKQYVDESLRER
ncbi:hemolysin secretion protein D [Ventosimonas gracilis]|uniref:Membrane fusion protein (MFP) family protein n=1 Tax=Ventosimonas gracilis TaxID=1680762 RepID=A0A139SHC0_9GAMM|nr:HlyD family type I secretion periplasmic adaptor subunit [Ventosimonas gracilis]KXU33968.1 hemolysin secretion protein D [Ventosimonas gracilis]